MSNELRIPNQVHLSRPWRIQELLPDFDLEDAWSLPTPGGPLDFPLLVQGAVSMDPSHSSSRATSALFALRWKLGQLFGWDQAGSGIGSRVPTLRDRLPDELRDTSPPEFEALPFSSLYLLDDEFAAEIANQTMHGVIHLGWVPQDDGSYLGEMAVWVKRNGVLGSAYMAAIAPFRHLFVYPPMLRETERRWRVETGSRVAAR